MRQLEAENADLKAKLEAANRRVAELGDTAARGISETTVVEPVVQQQQEAPVAPVAPVMAPPVFHQGAAGGGGEEPTAASGMLELAQRLHDEHVANGRAEGERIIGEARATGEQIVREAEDQRNRTLLSSRRSAQAWSTRSTSCAASSPITALVSRAICRGFCPTSRTARRPPPQVCEPGRSRHARQRARGRALTVDRGR